MEHIWFIYVIIICYFSVPYLQSVCDHIYEKKRLTFSYFLFICFFILCFFRDFFFPIITFISAYILTRMNMLSKTKRDIIPLLIFSFILVLLSIATNNRYIIAIAHIFIAYSKKKLVFPLQIF